MNGMGDNMKTSIHSCAIRKVNITDPLFGHYANLIARKVVPYQWEILNDRVPDAEPSYCVENFKIAAGDCEGKRRGVVFSDTDAYKWLEAVAYCIDNGSGKEYENLADELIDLIARAQQEDGYINTYYTIEKPEERWTNLAEGHELYTAGHLIEAAVAYYEATGKMKLLNVATKFADLICTVFGPEKEQHKGYPGHQEVELALVKLYRVTNEKRYLELAKHFVLSRGTQPNYLIDELEKNKENRFFPEFCDYDALYAQSHLPSVEQTEAVGHAVRAMYHYSAMADLASFYADEKLKESCGRLWENVTKKRMYVTGGIGSSGHLERFTTDYDLPNDRMYCESCASVGLMMFGQRMAELTREAHYYDEVERALCNTVLAGISAEGEYYFYVNPLEVWPDNCLPSTSMAHVKPIRQPWYSVACCPTNIARTLASLGRYIYAEDTKSIYINQLISSTLKTSLGENDVEISLESALLSEGKVNLKVTSHKDHPIIIRVRIPDYFREVSFFLEEKEIHPLIEKGYAVFAISRAGMQRIVIQGKVEPVFVASNAKVRADIGRVALAFGPFVYCLEEVDNGENLSALMVHNEAEVQVVNPEESLPGDLPVLLVNGYRIEQNIQDESQLYGKPLRKVKETVLKAIPYALWCNRTPGEMLVWIRETM